MTPLSQKGKTLESETEKKEMKKDEKTGLDL